MTLEHLTSGFESLLQTSLGASLLIICVVIVRAVFQRWLSMRIFYVLGLLVMLRLVVPFFPTSEFSLLHKVQQHSVQPLSSPIAAALSIPSLPADPPASATLEALTWMEGAAMVWAAGVVLMSIFVLGSYLRLRYWLRYQPRVTDPELLQLMEDCRKQVGVSSSVRLHIVDRLRTPAVFGFLRPRILIPEPLLELKHRDLRYILLHELTHIRRHDMFIGAFATLVALTHWFNPLVWFAFRQFSADREILCDRSVLKTLGSVPKEQYAYGMTLIKMLNLLATPINRSPVLVPLMTNKGEIERRVTLLGAPSKAHWTSRMAGLVAFALLVFVGFTIAAPSGHTRPHSKPGSDWEKGLTDVFISEEYTDDDLTGSHIAEHSVYWNTEHNREDEEHEHGEEGDHHSTH